VNSSTAVARLAGDRITHLPGATSPTIGAIGRSGTTSQTKKMIATTAGAEALFDTDSPVAVSTTLVSGTHFRVTAAGGVNNYATTFAEISSVTAGATTQAATVTDRTGWLG